MNNQLTLCGRLTYAPKAVTFKSGKRVVNFRLAVKDFSNPDEPLFIDVQAWNGLGEHVEKYLTKGREVVVSGRLALDTYQTTKDGVTREVVKPVMILSSYPHLCGPKPQAEALPQESSTEPNEEAVA